MADTLCTVTQSLNLYISDVYLGKKTIQIAISYMFISHKFWLTDMKNKWIDKVYKADSKWPLNIFVLFDIVKISEYARLRLKTD